MKASFRYDLYSVDTTVQPPIALTGDSLISNEYSISDDTYKKDSGVEQLLLLGLSYQDIAHAQARADWIYWKNPAGKAAISVLRHNESQTEIGLVSICKRAVWTPTGIANTGIFCDLVIDQAHRSLGPAVLLMEHAICVAGAESMDCVYSWPSERSFALFKRLPQAKIGSVEVLRRYFSWKATFEGRLPHVLVKPVGTVCQFIDCVLEIAKTAVINRLYTVRKIEHFGEEFDHLWTQARERFDEIGVRDAEFLNWRFVNNPSEKSEIHGLFSRDAKHAIGYVVYRRVDRKTVQISDFLTNKGGFVERCLLNSFCTAMRNSGYVKVSLLFTGNRKTLRSLSLCGFIRVGNRVSTSRHHSNSILSESPNSTFFTQADQDC